MNKYGYITLLSNDEYIHCVIALYSSWVKTNSNYSFYCACTKDVSNKVRNNLKELDINIIDLQEIKGLNNLITKLYESGYNSWVPALSKLAIYGLEQFDKLIFLDADVYVYKNLDNLFKRDHLTAVCDGEGRETGDDKFVKGDNYFNKFNAGMVVIEPSKKLLEKIVESTKTLTIDRPWADQNIVSELYPNWPNEKEKHLPIYYNCFGRHIFEYEKNVKNFDIKNICVLHLVGRKMSPTYGFENIFKSNKHETYCKLLVDICNNVNDYIRDKHEKNIIKDVPLIKTPPCCDLVVPYVDSQDKSWQELFNKYNPIKNIEVESVNAKNRFRGQGDFFRFFFRCVARNMPWIRKIHLIVQSDSQVPSWLDRDKICVVHHEDFIPKEYLPTFNSCTIEMFLWNIPNLSERFIYANDDFFCLKETSINDFFDGVGVKQNFKTDRDSLLKADSMFAHHCFNCFDLIFDENDKFIRPDHEFKPDLRSIVKECFDKYKNRILKSISQFREDKNINCFVYSLYQVKKNLTKSSNLIFYYLGTYDKNKLDRSDIVCINDHNTNGSIYDDSSLIDYFCNKYSGKSIYELNNNAIFENRHLSITQEVIRKKKWFEEAIWYGWVKPEEYEEFKKKYGL